MTGRGSTRIFCLSSESVLLSRVALISRDNSNLHASTYDEFQSYVGSNYNKDLKGGLWFGDESSSPTIAYQGESSVTDGVGWLNLLTNVRSRTPVGISLGLLGSVYFVRPLSPMTKNAPGNADRIHYRRARAKIETPSSGVSSWSS
jgi:hypothetical protein